MSWTTRFVSGLRASAGRARPRVGRLLARREADAVRDYPATGLTPRRLTTILRAADAGDVTRAMELFEEMEEKDAHLFAVANKRRLALTGLPWSVVSAAEVEAGVDRAAADAAADYCRAVLTRLEGFEDVLQHLALALGRNIAVAELVWTQGPDGLTLEDIVPVEFTRMTFDATGCLRLLTADDDRDGVALPPHKFVVHAPHAVSGHAMRGGLLRATALVFLAKNLALKDWMIGAELFGMPVRVARYDASVTPEEKEEMLHMLESLGSNAAGVFSKAIELQFLEAGQGKAPPPYGQLCEFLNREMSKAWLGQTLTTETPGLGGSFGATRIHEEVRKDLRSDDLRKEARTLRRDLLAPLARLRFGPNAPVPYFRRQVEGPRNLDELTAVLDAAVNRLGLAVPADWTRRSLGLPQPAEGEALLAGAE
jgi:phage gp29-like protein